MIINFLKFESTINSSCVHGVINQFVPEYSSVRPFNAEMVAFPQNMPEKIGFILLC